MAAVDELRALIANPSQSGRSPAPASRARRDAGWPIARCIWTKYRPIAFDFLASGKMPRGSRAPPWPRLAGIYLSGRIGDKLSLQHNFELSPLLHPNTEAIVLAGTPLRT